MSDPSLYTIGWICAIVPEFVAARLFLDEVHEEPRSLSKNDNNSYKLGRMGKHNVAIAVLPHGEYGESSAAVVARDMVRTFENIRVGLMVGIGGGAPSLENDIRLGDIVVSSPTGGYGGVLQYDFGKSVEGGKFEMTGFLNQPPIALRTALNALIADFEIEGNWLGSDIQKALKSENLKQKYGRPSSESDRLFRSNISYDANKATADYGADDFVDRPERSPESVPVVHHGLIASANQVMKDANKRDILAKDKNVLCFEMEAAGLMNHFPCLVIRGICDYSDSHKNKQWQGYAAMAAAAFAKALVCRIPRQSLENEQSIAEGLSILKSVGEDVVAIRDSIDYDTLEKLRAAKGAEFDSYQNQHEARCHPNTRVNVLREIEHWAHELRGQRIYWLSGMAGTGKSVIARTVAHSLNEANLLGATFFFKRGERDRSSASLVFSTLAKQLVRRRPELSPFIIEAIRQTDNLSSKSLEEQFAKLILGPLKKSGSKSGSFQNLVLIVEALDECSDEKDVEALLNLLSKAANSDVCALKLFVTSRPEIAMRDAFDSINGTSYLQHRLQDTPHAIISRDIALYLQHQLSEIRAWWNKRYNKIPSEQLQMDWPGDEKIKALVEIAIPLFLFAAIACRFIRDDLFGSPEEQLLKLIQVAKEGGVHDKLGETYRPVLRQFQSKRNKQEQKSLMQRFRKVIGTIILLEQPLAISSIAGLLGLKISEISGILSPLKSVLDIPEEQELEVKLFHLSFRDFLLSPVAGDFSINFKETHWQMALACLDLLSISLRYNMANLKPADQRSTIANGVLEKQLPPHVRYACLHWFHHLELAGKPLQDDDAIHRFLQGKFLHWLEALSILGEADCGTRTPEKLLPLVEVSYATSLRSPLVGNDPTCHSNKEQPDSRLFEILEDADSFVSKHVSVLVEFPLQIYWSALVFSPTSSAVRNAFVGSIPSCIKFQSPHKSGWVPLVQNAGLVRNEQFFHVAISPDSRLVAFSQSGDSILMWSVSTGACLTEIPCGSDLSAGNGGPIAFFNDSKRIASELRGKISIYLAETGERLHDLRVDIWSPVVQIDVSRDSEMIAVSYANCTAEICTIATGRRRELSKEGFPNRNDHVNNSSMPQGRSLICFSPDSQFVATSSCQEIDVWDVSTGSCLRTFNTNAFVLCPLSFVPNTNLLLVQEAEGEIRTLDITTGHWTFRASGRGATHGDISVSYDARFLAYESPTNSNSVSISSFDTGELYHTLNFPGTPGVESTGSRFSKSAIFSPDGKFLVTMRRDEAAIWSMSMIQRSKKLKDETTQSAQPEFMPTRCCFIHWDSSENSPQLVSMHESDEVNLWSSYTGDLLQTLKDERARFDNGTAMLAPDSKHIFLPHGLSIQTTREKRIIRVLEISQSAGYDPVLGRGSVIFSADSGSFAFGSFHDFSLWTLEEGLQFRDPACIGTLITVAPDWKSAAYIVEAPSLPGEEDMWDEANHKIRFLSIETGKHFDLPEEVDSFSALAISPDSKWIASVPGRSEELTLWSTSKCSRQALLRHETRITAIAFSSQSDLLASADKAQEVRIWSMLSGQCAQVLKVGRSLLSMSFSPDDAHLRTAFGEILISKSTDEIPELNATSDDEDSENTSVVVQKPRWHGYGIDVSGKWITWNGANIISLPLDVNPSSNMDSPRWFDDDKRYRVAAGEFLVAWVSPAGELYTIGFSRDVQPFDQV
ncbi:pfs domain-containing protein [Colletotrichum orchidophilum]|uniref:Pfs domain-containing protein n=1 Tax=Colletotrichum orchidophilum TaxID=1209926 RepID=A0A1G4BQZ8_9PEZI|nr:pfs domain-containing protein [Colletotrichum orchidophilum]OHF03755.1 pfs domain-containing protein [Colletotrichum orchidophilum]